MTAKTSVRLSNALINNTKAFQRVAESHTSYSFQVLQKKGSFVASHDCHCVC